MAKKLGLGKNFASLGLKELLSDLDVNAVNTNAAAPSPGSAHLQKLPVDLIHPGKYQPRKTVDQAALEELANSIRAQGLIQPIVVRADSEKTYEIIAGERRWRAAQLAGMHEIPVILRQLSDEQALAISLIENIQRENLNAIDEAEALQRLCDEFAMTHQEIAEAVGKSRATVTNLLRLLGLTPDVKNMLSRGELEMGHARALLVLPGLQQTQAANTVVTRKLSVRETERLVNTLLNKKSNLARETEDPNLIRLQRELSDKIGAKTILRKLTKQKGQIIIHYNNLEELDGILERIGK